MMDITRDEIWEEQSSRELNKRKNKKGTIMKFTKEHKIISIAIICLTILIITNVYLIGTFFKIISNL